MANIDKLDPMYQEYLKQCEQWDNEWLAENPGKTLWDRLYTFYEVPTFRVWQRMKEIESEQKRDYEIHRQKCMQRRIKF